VADLVLALDLGTGSCKASVWHPDGRCIADAVESYPTSYRGPLHEQRLDDWWDAVVASTRSLLASDSVPADAIAAIAVSGHSLGVIGLDDRGKAAADRTPIWSDSRGQQSADRFFDEIDADHWYRITGNGFPAGLYPVFKLGWYALHEPRFTEHARTIVGSKDWVNARLTGVVATDPSYASGFGAWDLRRGAWSSRILDAAGVDESLLPPVVASTSVLGPLTASAAHELGLSTRVLVTAGGVDNSCMSAGSLNVRAGSAFVSLGSSSWFVATGDEPVIEPLRRPYTFASLTPGLFDSALSSFSAGTSLRWVRALLGGGDPIDDTAFVDLARESVTGAHGLLFLPMLTGGAPHEGGPSVRGALLGLDSGHTRSDIARAALEGTAFAVARAGRQLSQLVGDRSEIVVSGGGSRSAWIRQLYADVLGCAVIATTVDQQAAALGAASTAFVGLGAWSAIADSERAHDVVARHEPRDAEAYEQLVDRFEAAMADHFARTSEHQGREMHS
jgi:xylulokinase